LLDEEV